MTQEEALTQLELLGKLSRAEQERDALQKEYEDLLVDRNVLLGKLPALQQENERLKAEAETRSDLLVGKVAALDRQRTVVRELADALEEFRDTHSGECLCVECSKARAALARAKELK